MHRLRAKLRWVGEGTPGGYQEYDQTKVIEIGKSRMETRQEEKEEWRGVTRLHHGLQKREIREQVGHATARRAQRKRTGSTINPNPGRRVLEVGGAKINKITPIVRLKLNSTFKTRGVFGKWEMEKD